MRSQKRDDDGIDIYQLMAFLGNAADDKFGWLKLANLEHYVRDFPDPKQPNTSVIVAAYLRRLELLVRTLEGDITDFSRIRVVILEVLSEFDELGSCLEETADDTDEYARFLMTIGGYTFTQAAANIEKLHQQRAGAPPKRHLYLTMLDTQETQQLSLQRLTFVCCPCGKNKHDQYCRDRIRHGLKTVRDIVEKYKNQDADSERLREIALSVESLRLGQDPAKKKAKS